MANLRLINIKSLCDDTDVSKEKIYNYIKGTYKSLTLTDEEKEILAKKLEPAVIEFFDLLGKKATVE
jgi:hypothetical protein